MIVQSPERNFIIEVQAASLEETAENFRIQKERRPDIEAEALSLDEAGAATDSVMSLIYRDVSASVAQQHGGSETARPGTDDRYLFGSKGPHRKGWCNAEVNIALLCDRMANWFSGVQLFRLFGAEREMGLKVLVMTPKSALFSDNADNRQPFRHAFQA